MLLDTSAWVEFFIGSEKGKRVKELLEKNSSYTSIVSLAELTNWSLKEGRGPKKFVETVRELSSVMNLDDDISILAGKLNYERKKENKKWGMLDSFVLATGILYDLGILTSDKDFKDVPLVEIL
jgi:Predicted nucleic acid-binding protein, contains PIN domain